MDLILRHNRIIAGIVAIVTLVAIGAYFAMSGNAAAPPTAEIAAEQAPPLDLAAEATETPPPPAVVPDEALIDPADGAEIDEAGIDGPAQPAGANVSARGGQSAPVSEEDI